MHDSDVGNWNTAHTWQVVAQGTVSYAHKAMLQAGEIMAATALEVMRSPDILATAKAEHKKRLGDKPILRPSRQTSNRQSDNELECERLVHKEAVQIFVV